MEDGYLNFNTEFARYIVIALAAPFWIPFVGKVWREVENALREEGGVFGRAPTHDQLVEIRRQKQFEEDPLINEPFVRGMARPTQQKGSTQASAPSAGQAPAPKRGGFRN